AAVIGTLLRRQRQRRPEHVVAVGKMKSFRHDADDRVRFVVQTNRLPDDSSISAVPARPQAVAEQRDMRRSGTIFILGEGASEERLHLKDGEELRRDRLAVDADWLAVSGHAPTAIPDRGQIAEYGVSHPPIVKV